MRLTPTAVLARAGRRVVLATRKGVVVRARGVPAADLAPPAGSGILDAYVRGCPSPQLAIDVFAGEWASELPAHLGVVAGQATLFADDRIDWVLDQFDAKGSRVLELGPLEGGHSYQLSAAGAEVTAVEANSRAYLKCLVAKELLGVTGCTFLLGNFTAYLEAHPDERFDLVLASGVLYHATDPLHLLELLSQASPRVAIWTHYYDADRAEAIPGVDRYFDPVPYVATFRGREVRLHRRDYLESLRVEGFCGGPEPHSFWMERDDLLAVLRLLGYDDVRIGSDDPDHVNGPCILLYAERTA